MIYKVRAAFVFDIFQRQVYVAKQRPTLFVCDSKHEITVALVSSCSTDHIPGEHGIPCSECYVWILAFLASRKECRMRYQIRNWATEAYQFTLSPSPHRNLINVTTLRRLLRRWKPVKNILSKCGDSTAWLDCTTREIKQPDANNDLFVMYLSIVIDVCCQRRPSCCMQGHVACRASFEVFR